MITKAVHIPKNWDQAAHQLWHQGEKMPAVQQVLTQLNADLNRKKPAELILQLSYYLFFCGDYLAATQVLQEGLRHDPKHPEILKNLAVCLGYTGQYQAAIDILQQYKSLRPNDYLMYDSLAANYAHLGQFERAQQAGEMALALKDQQHGQVPKEWQLPTSSAQVFLNNHPQLKQVISFSLWGENPRYLKGALDNLQAAAYLYPQWQLRFYLDDSVPKVLCAQLQQGGAELIFQPKSHSLREKLAWRFQVANDADVGRFLVRDVDSVLSLRERLAVEEWIASDQFFHLMRDWWTHTDLILAGMWGGISGVLPNLKQMLDSYHSPSVETPNIDQWFLRDCVWRYVKSSCLIHDRCYRSLHAQAWPTVAQRGHVGQDESVANAQAQQIRLLPWQDLVCLKLK